VTAGRQTPFKQTDIIVTACTQLNLPLTVIGRGPEHNRLVRMAGPTITFLDTVSDAEMPGHLAAAKAFLFAAFEDFGVTPVEAMAAGTPVIAYRGGGALDYVIEGKTGLFFEEQTAESLGAILRGFDALQFASDDIKSHARAFSHAVFQQKVQELLELIPK